MEREEECESDRQGEKRKWKVYMVNYTAERVQSACLNNFCIS